MAVFDKDIKVLMLKGEKGDSGDAGDYDTLTDKPKINNIVLQGNKTAAELSLATAADITAIGANITAINTNIGLLTDLNTTDKNSIVNAINEVNTKATYGTGYWSPTLSSFGVDPLITPTVTYEYYNGIYYKVGNLVYVSARMKFKITNAGNGYAIVTGLPFSATNIDNRGVPYSVTRQDSVGNFVNADPTNPILYIPNDSTWVRLQSEDGGMANSWKTAGDKWKYLGFSGVYITND